MQHDERGSETTDARRRALEAAAYGDAASDDDRRAALDELRAGEAERGREAGLGHPAGVDPADREPASGEPADEAPDAPADRPRRRLLLGGAVAAALAVGLIGGALAQHGLAARQASEAATASASAEPSASGDPAATSRLAAGDPAFDTHSQAQLTAADALLTVIRTPADALPTAVFSREGVDVTTSHLIATTADGTGFWIARSSDHAGYCLVANSAQGSTGASTGDAVCTPADTFAVSGAALATSDFTATWKGGTVVVTVSGESTTGGGGGGGTSTGN